MSLIKMENIYKIFRNDCESIYALDNVSCNFSKGEFSSIIGSSGSGKSTMMSIMGCLDYPSSGNYFINDKNTTKISERELCLLRSKYIGFVFQSFHLVNTLTAFENIELPLIYRSIKKSERKKLVNEALEKVGLSHRKSHLPSKMSGGQQQRVAIARAIVNKPPIILADEPTGNLDTANSNDIMSVFNQFYDDGKTIIIITHDKSVAKKSPRCIELRDGVLISDSKYN